MGIDSKFVLIAKNSNKWQRKIDSYNEPRDDYERTFYQFRLSMSYVNVARKIRRNIESIFLFPVLFTISTIKAIRKKPVESTYNECDCLILQAGEKYTNYGSVESIVPKSITEKYNKIKIVDSSSLKLNECINSAQITKTLINFFIRYPVFPLLNFRVFSKIATINYYIQTSNPKAIVTIGGENDYTSSMVTCYCESNNIPYICIMHGEYFMSPYHAFVRFSKFYVWDDYYKLQFVKTRSPKDIFITYKPNRYKMRDIKKCNENVITYYLQDFTLRQLESIRNTLLILVEKGYRCKVRPHRRATNMRDFNAVFNRDSRIEIEDNSVPIEESFSSCKYIVSMYSTVISEGYFNGLSVLIDDVSDKVLYESLKSIMFININRVPGRLSTLLDAK